MISGPHLIVFIDILHSFQAIIIDLNIFLLNATLSFFHSMNFPLKLNLPIYILMLFPSQHN